jgi:short subunit dehydrogenase-like uncharacterized protein
MAAPLIYGAYGYTGELVAREAVRADLDPILAGRRERPLRELATELDVSYRVAELDELEAHLTDVEVCLHCAGPFVDTHRPAVEACLASGTHYLDITGETPALAGISEYDEAAREAGVMLLPGAGFEVVPSDCLASRLSERLPGATRLTLAFSGQDVISPGTARTAGRLLGDGVHVREDGDLRTVPFGSRTREIDTGTGDGRQRMGIYPFGDVVTAYHTTGIPNIEVYGPDVMGLPPAGQRVLGALQPVFSIDFVQRALMRLGERNAVGPDAEERAEETDFFWGEVSDGERSVSGRVHTTNDYQFTAESMVEIAERVLDGEFSPGFQTPAGAYGAELVSSIGGATFEGFSDTDPT